MELMNLIVCIKNRGKKNTIRICLFIIGPEKSSIMFTPIAKRLWPYWDRFFTLSFAWESVSSYPDGRAQLTVNVPRVIGTWIVSAFSISQASGLTVLPNVISVNKYFILPDCLYNNV
jgi:hypothetical protein